MVFTGTCAKGKPLFATDKKQAFPFLKKSEAETMLKCLNEPSGLVTAVGNDYGVLRQSTDEKQGAPERREGQAAPTNL